MSKAKRICFDKILPSNMNRVQRTMMLGGGRTRAISPVGKQWINGSTITIRFLSGTQEQKDMVVRIAPEWTKHANLKFEFTDNPRADIRVQFDANDGAWSYVGTDNKSIPVPAATLNLGWQDQGVILHEFGHMIGLSHEHQNPEGGIVWNEQVVIDDLAGPPNFWTEAETRHNVLDKYSADQVHGTEFDPLSVMLYSFPDEWTQNMGATSENNDMSQLDRDFVRSEKMYPGLADPDERAVDLPICTATSAGISAAGEEDLYRFKVSKQGQHTIETSGSTDVVLSLFGPDSLTQFVAENDDGGVGRNSRITADLQAGTYYAKVRHYSASNTGEYRIRVTAE